MYTIHVNSGLLFSSDQDDAKRLILNPRLSLDVNGAGSLTFVVPPGNIQYDAIKKLQSIITVKEDDEVIFRGRAMDDEKDFYNQKNVYCEGDRSFLMDSQCEPYVYSGTAKGLLKQLLDRHNAQVYKSKQFTLGNVTAVKDSDTVQDYGTLEYCDTLSEIDEKLLSAFGGYLMTRTVGDTTYLDWLADSGSKNGQKIEFSVNLLDVKNTVDAADVFTCLIPLGASILGEHGEYKPPVNITSVNNGMNYIQDDDAVALYGKIWRTKTWSHEEDPAKLLKKAQDYMKMGVALQTLSLKAVDMHFISSSAKAIRVGQHVRILSEPHGLDITMRCTKIDIDLLNPENTTYTFGEQPRTLTGKIVRTEKDVSDLNGGGGGGRSVKDELKDYIRWADIRANADEALIELLTGEVSQQGERLSKAEITLDGVNAQIVLKADVSTVNEIDKRVTAAEIEIDGLNAQIVLKASQTVVDELGERVSSAEIEIDGLNSEITLKADKVTIDAELTTIKNYFAGKATVAKMICTNLTALAFTFENNKVKWDSMEVVTSVSGNATGEIAVRDAAGTIVGTALTGYRTTYKTEQIYYLTW